MFKRLIAACVAAVSLLAAAAPYDLVIQQFDAGGFGILSNTVPPNGVSCVVYYDLSANAPVCAAMAGGLTLSGGVLSGSGAGTAATWSTLTGKPIWVGVFDGSWATMTGTPTTLAGFGITDAYPSTGNPSGFLTSISSGSVTTALGFTPYNATNPNGYVNLAGAKAAFNFGLPAAKTVSLSTDYQAADPSKAAIITPTFTCTNATQVLVSSACTLQIRLGASTITCSTGTIIYTQSLTVSLGVLLTQASSNPVQINLPIGAHFIACPTAGTFTIAAVEQAIN